MKNLALLFTSKILIPKPMRKNATHILISNLSLLPLFRGFHFQKESTYIILFHLRKTPEEKYSYQSHAGDEENKVQRSEEVSCSACQWPTETRINSVHSIQNKTEHLLFARGAGNF